MIINNWKKYKLGSVSEIITGFPFKSNLYELNGKLRVIRGINVTLGFLRWEDDQRCWNHSTKDLEKYFISKNDIVIGMDGSRIGKNRAIVKQSDLPAILAQRVARIRAIENISHQKYLWYTINSDKFEQYIDVVQTGSAIPHMSPSQIADFEISLPPLPEQTAIASILSSLDDKIELNLQTNKTLEEMANALYKHWFVDFGPFQGGKFVESELGMIPEGFTIRSFKDVCFNHSKTYNFKEKEKVVFINTGDILDGKFLHNNLSDVDSLPGQAKKIIEPNDILFSEIRPGNKRYALIIFDTSNYVVSTKFMVIRTNENILPRILYRILRDEKIINEFQSIAEGRSGTFPQITFDSISHINFPMANIKIQNEFMEKILPMENLIERNNLEIETLKQTRDFLLPKLISGEIRVKDAEKKIKSFV